MKILSNKKYNSLVEKANKICTTTTYYLNNPYQTKTIEKLEDKNVELEIQVDKLKKKFKKIHKKYVDIRDKKISELLRENAKLNDLLEGEHKLSQMYLNKIIEVLDFIKENENNISSIKDLENNKTYNSALLSVKDILQGVDKE